MKISSALFVVIAVVALLLLARTAEAAACGAAGQRACTVFERIPSCDKNLVEKSGKCKHPACGRTGERACLVSERIPSCDDDLVESGGKCLSSVSCGAEGEHAWRDRGVDGYPQRR
jgi:hypothetical protein